MLFYLLMRLHIINNFCYSTTSILHVNIYLMFQLLKPFLKNSLYVTGICLKLLFR